MSQIISYNGKIAYVDLTTQTVKIEPLKENTARDFLGGAGLSAKLIYDLLDDSAYKTLKNDPFSPINPLVFATGPITGTERPASGRYSVCAISPLTNIWGESTSGGHFCISLRDSGFDAIVITGKAVKPIYLYLSEGKFSFMDASKLWGKDTYETQELIRNEIKNDKIKVACIGPSGEKLVRFASVMNDEGRAAGRCGMGAIMGSKNLKAVAIVGSKGTIPETPNKEAIRDLRKQINYILEDDLVGSIVPKVMNIFGTNTYMDMGSFAGDVPANYFTETEFPAELLTSKTLKEQFPMFISGCARCSLQCAKQTVIPDNGNEICVDGPEYESMAAFGSLTGSFEAKKVILAHHLGNVFGLDTISSGVTIAFLIYLVENGLATKTIKNYLKEMKIEDLHWGNGDIILKLMKLINERKEIGDVLAEGTKRMAKILDVDPELAAHVKGLEIPMHDPRAYAGQALSYMTACCGAHHQKCDWFQVESQSISFPEYDINPGNRFDISGRESGVIAFQDIRAIDDAAVNCDFETPPKFSDVAKYISLVTDFKYTPKLLLQAGERMTNIKRLISCNLGITREDDKLPEIVKKALPSGPTEGVKLDLEKNLKKYYELRGWDWKTGRPTNAKLKELRIIGDDTDEIIRIEERKVPEEKYQEMEKLKTKYIPLLQIHNIPSEAMEEYLHFIATFALCEEDFQDEFGGIDEGVLFEIKSLPEDDWHWLRLEKGNFYTGRGKLDSATLVLTFRDQKAFDGIMNMTLNPVTAVLSNRLKVKPMGKVKIFQNFIGLYLSKFDLKL
ncbi:MAG: aldehyde ferredoxin oxidoreductase family protein [Candidatus Heimdallarchaeota archaeon]|nr:aldehyde ferredoxin oxidoreductase family protein [Candidatus Heimdallarchaeota archaeon]